MKRFIAIWILVSAGDSLDVTIIGNIYENPELLEVNHDTIR